MSEMNEMFYRDAYIREFDSRVVSCVKGKKYYEVILEDTAFYPEGGGQPADHGTLNGTAVVDTKRRDDAVIHFTKEPVEGSVHGVIDWARRFDHMQQHSGEHMVSGLIHQKYGYENIGFHLGEEVITLDFSGFLTFEGLREIEDRANELIWKNEKILVSYPDENELASLEFRSKKELSGKVRIVTVPDADVCACCGTHVTYTGEIGLVKILSCINKKEGSRVEMLAGKRAFEHLRKTMDQNLEVSRALSAKPYETAEAVRKLQDDYGKQRYLTAASIRKYFDMKLQNVEPNQKLVMDFEENMDMIEVRKYADALVQTRNIDTCGAFSKTDTGYNYVILSKSVNLRDYVKQMNAALNGRGGGSPELIQGTYKATEEEIKEVLTEYFG